MKSRSLLFTFLAAAIILVSSCLKPRNQFKAVGTISRSDQSCLEEWDYVFDPSRLYRVQILKSKSQLLEKSEFGMQYAGYPFYQYSVATKAHNSDIHPFDLRQEIDSMLGPNNVVYRDSVLLRVDELYKIIVDELVNSALTFGTGISGREADLLVRNLEKGEDEFTISMLASHIFVIGSPSVPFLGSDLHLLNQRLIDDSLLYVCSGEYNVLDETAFQNIDSCIDSIFNVHLGKEPPAQIDSALKKMRSISKLEEHQSAIDLFVFLLKDEIRNTSLILNSHQKSILRTGIGRGLIGRSTVSDYSEGLIAEENYIYLDWGYGDQGDALLFDMWPILEPEEDYSQYGANTVNLDYCRRIESGKWTRDRNSDAIKLEFGSESHEYYRIVGSWDKDTLLLTSVEYGLGFEDVESDRFIVESRFPDNRAEFRLKYIFELDSLEGVKYIALPHYKRCTVGGKELLYLDNCTTSDSLFTVWSMLTGADLTYSWQESRHDIERKRAKIGDYTIWQHRRRIRVD